MSLDNNPLKQYFRRPAVYLRLPSGGQGYRPGVMNIPESGELPVYPMTAIDEITVKTPDALYNGSAISELIKSCVPDIKDPWAITSVDLDSILIAIKAAAGSDLEIESQCPSCEEVAQYGVNLVAALASLKSGDYSVPLQINDLHIKFRPLTYKEMNEASIAQFEIQRVFASIDAEPNEEAKNKRTQEALKRITELTMQILARTIEYIQTPTVTVDKTEFIVDFMKNCDKNVYVTIRDHNAQLKAQTEMKPLDIKCVHCGHEYKQTFTLNASDFFG